MTTKRERPLTSLEVKKVFNDIKNVGLAGFTVEDFLRLRRLTDVERFGASSITREDIRILKERAKTTRISRAKFGREIAELHRKSKQSSRKQPRT